MTLCTAWRRLVVCLALVVFSIPASAGEGWRNTFDSLSSRTVKAMEMDPAELSQLVAACDELRPSIEALDETPRKVYLRKLEKVRNLYRFVLESKQAAPQQ